MSAHVLLNLLNDLGKRNKMRGLMSILSRFATSSINQIIQKSQTLDSISFLPYFYFFVIMTATLLWTFP